MILLSDVLNNTNNILMEKYDHNPVRSCQIKALAEALVDAINEKLEELQFDDGK